MGIQGSTIKKPSGKFSLERYRRGSAGHKRRIEILAFEVANVMSKLVQLWQSVSDQEIRRFRSEVMKSEGVLNLVSDNESILLSLACMEKLQDLTAVAHAVSRLGKRCHVPALVGFEHVFHDLLKQNINAGELEYSLKEMEINIRKMEKYITATCNLYQELEILTETEQAVRRFRAELDPAQKDSLYVLEQKLVWQRQEIKYLKEISLWNRTYDKIVSKLARAVCTIYARIIRVFGLPSDGWPQILSARKNGTTTDSSGSTNSCLSTEEMKQSDASLQSSISPVSSYQFGSAIHPTTSAIQREDISTYESHSIQCASSGNNLSMALCFSPARQFAQRRSMSVNNASRTGRYLTNMMRTVSVDDMAIRDGNGCLLHNGELIAPLPKRGTNKFLFDPKTRLQNAPESTLGGAGLALHYANIILMVEKMARNPHVITRDARDDLYQMLPNSLKNALRAQLRLAMRPCSSPQYLSEILAINWRAITERALCWLVPLSHNMIRWQSEHNFEQQQVVSRSNNVLLLQTLYFADQVKVETVMTELLVGLNWIWRQVQDSARISLRECVNSKDVNEYLEW